MDREFLLNTTEQLQALAHPTRHRIINYLVDHSATNQQIAAALGEPPARIHFHVRELWTAGLVILVEERIKGGVVEKYYQAAARSFRLGDAFQFGLNPHEPASDALGLSLLAAAEQDLQAALGSFTGNLHPFVSAHFQGTLSAPALQRVQHWIARIGQEFGHEATSAETQSFTLTLVLHPLPPPLKGEHGDGAPLE
jgi:DNA-binding transcriptional ArsR family regulator